MPQLEYAPPLGRRRLIRRSALIAVVVGGIALSMPLLKSSIARARVVRLYERCENPERATESRYEQIILQNWSSQFAGEMAKPWRELNADLSTDIFSYATIFLGRLRTPDGTRQRLVGVDVVQTAMAPTLISTHARTVISGNVISPPRYGAASDQTISLPGVRTRLIVHPGSVDPKDASHFTVTYDTSDGHGTVDGWLKDDESVVLEPRADAATTAPAPRLRGKSL